jgi:RHS repeat-associated protein
LNRLISRTVEQTDNQTNATQTTTQHFIHDNNQIILEFLDSELAQRNFWGAETDELLAVDNLIDDETLWVLADHLNSTRKILKSDNDQVTNITTIEYDAFGNVVSGTNPINIAYTGKYHDEITNLQWNINRWYDPNLGQWISEDPIGFNAGDPNLYRYVENNPIDMIDGDGLQNALDMPDNPLGKGNEKLWEQLWYSVNNVGKERIRAILEAGWKFEHSSMYSSYSIDTRKKVIYFDRRTWYCFQHSSLTKMQNLQRAINDPILPGGDAYIWLNEHPNAIYGEPLQSKGPSIHAIGYVPPGVTKFDPIDIERSVSGAWKTAFFSASGLTIVEPGTVSRRFTNPPTPPDKQKLSDKEIRADIRATQRHQALPTYAFINDGRRAQGTAAVLVADDVARIGGALSGPVSVKLHRLMKGNDYYFYFTYKGKYVPFSTMPKNFQYPNTVIELNGSMILRGWLGLKHEYKVSEY